MAQVHNVTLELVRPGPPHNQLLSPLTPYMALCGDGSPITFHIDFEHRQLLNRLERLRYIVPDGKNGYSPVPNKFREAQLRELGEDMGRILAHIPSLNAELARTRGQSAAEGLEFVHVRLVLSGSELSILPFELAISPQSYPGEGLEISLQGSLPVVFTREIRRSRPLPVSWGDKREPKILFISAEPAGMAVPKRAHAAALREAMEPWIEWPKSKISGTTGTGDGQTPSAILDSRPLSEVKKRLRILNDASIRSIYKLCSEENFSHIHILAHGAEYEHAGERRFGIALCEDGKPGQAHVVSGKKLASALRAESKDGNNRSEPLMVTLATCDSGQQNSVLIPGGSIAHDLHAAGIPWVLASQFPLTKEGSVRLAKFLYPKLLRGDDPRQVLFELRRRLAMTANSEHDWASVVAYASIENDLDHKVSSFLEMQTIAALEVRMGRADILAEELKIFSTSERNKEKDEQLRKLVDDELVGARQLLERWESRIKHGTSPEDRMARSKCFGMKGSTLKRIGLLHALLGITETAKHELEESLDAYRSAMDEWVTDESRLNWTSCQYLALSMILKAGPDPDTFAMCKKISTHDLSSPDASTKAWAHATLAELYLISWFHNKHEPDETKKKVLNNLDAMLALVDRDSFHVHSTRRQFQRYVDNWNLKRDPSEVDKTFAKIAKKAAEKLVPVGADNKKSPS